MLVFSKVRTYFTVLLVLALAGPLVAQQTATEFTPNVEAQSVAVVTKTHLAMPADAAWFAHANVKRLLEHPLGQRALGLAEAAIREETNDFDGAFDLKTARDKIAEVIGFDPLEGIASVTVYGTTNPFETEARSDDEVIENMAATSVAIISLTGGTGNLEGFALAAPGYQSTDYEGATIHSGTIPDSPIRVYMAVLQPSTAIPGVVVLGMEEARVKAVLDLRRSMTIGKLGGLDPLNDIKGPDQYTIIPAVDGAFLAAGLELGEGTFRVMEIPEQQSAVAQMLERVTFSLGTIPASSMFAETPDGNSDFATHGKTTAQIALDVVDEQRAEQVRQLITGAIAFTQLPIKELEQEEEFVIVREILRDVEVSRENMRVLIRVSKPTDALLQTLMQFGGIEYLLTR